MDLNLDTIIKENDILIRWLWNRFEIHVGFKLVFNMPEATGKTIEEAFKNLEKYLERKK